MDTVGVTDPRQDWYKKFFDQAAVGMVISDDDFRFVEVNPAFCEMLGYTKEELLKKTIFEVTYEDDVQVSSEKLRKQFGGKISSFHLEKRYVRKDGGIVWGSVTTMTSPGDEKRGGRLSFAVIEDITGRKKLQEDLLKSGESYRGLFDTVDEAVYIQDSEGKFLDVNKGAERMYGYPRDWFIGKSPLDVSAPGKNNLDNIGRLVGEAFKGKPQEFEFWGVRSNGEVFPKEVGVYKGKYFGKDVVIAIAKDITQRKKLEAEILISELRYRRLFEAAKDGILILDFETGIILDVNQFLIDELGFTKEEILKKHLWEVGSFKDIVASKANFEELKSKNYVRYEDQPIETKDGKKIPVEFVSNVYNVGEGKTIQCNVRDISIRKKAELETAGAKARLEAILEGIGEGILVVDDLGKIQLFNRMAQKISGYKFEEVFSKNYWEIVTFTPEGLSAPNSDFIRQTLSEKKLSEASAQLLGQKNGGKILVSASASPVFGKNSNLLGVVVVFRDITKQREVERMRDDFMMIASHELRAPMTAIKWLVASLLEGTYGVVSELMKSPLVNIATSTDRLIHLVNDMISVTRLEGGSSKLVLSNFDIKPLISNLLEVFGTEAKRKKIRVNADGISPGVVHADSDGLTRIFSNLIDNALKFTNEGGTITLTMKNDPEFLNIYVADTGVGIPENFVDKLFVKFEQVRSKADVKTVGTGLGLYISRELARNMGGDLWLEKSEVGKGSVFGIKITK